MFSGTLLQERYAGFCAAAQGFFIPYTGLNFADMGGTEDQHAQTALADSSADGIRKLSGEQCFVEREQAAIFAAGFCQLLIKALRADADSHTGERMPIEESS